MSMSRSPIPFRLAMLLSMLALAAVAESFVSDSMNSGAWSIAHNDGLGLSAQTCNGLVGDCIDEEEEMMTDSEINRRGLRPSVQFISYEALKRNSVPCHRRGRSYYGCNSYKGRRANPYRRGCTAITQCTRYLH